MKKTFATMMLVCILVLMACAPAATPTQHPTITPTHTPYPTSTPTPTTTPTPTVTSTPSPDQIAELLDLPIENGPSPYKHSYKIEGDNLMDYLTPVPTIAAQRVNGEWTVVTDPTIRYSDLADTGIKPVLLRTDFFRGTDRNTKVMGFYVVFTGEYQVIDWYYSRMDKTIKDYRGKAVYLDGDGTVQEVWISMFSPDMPGLIWFKTYNPDTRGSGVKGVTLDKALQGYRPGQKWKVSFQWEGPHMEMVSKACFPDYSGNLEPVLCNEVFNLRTVMRYEQDANLRAFVASWEDDNENSSSVPSGLVIPHHSFQVVKDSNYVSP